MKGLVCLLLLLETFVCVVQHQVDGGLNENEISQQLRSEDGRQNPPQTDTLRDEASTDSQQNYHLFFTDIHAALRELTATVTEQKVNIRELTATVTEQKVNIRELTATVTEQKVNIRELTTTVTEQKVNIRELTATVTEQKTINRELTATVTEQKVNIRELTATVTEQKTINRELTATVTEQKVNIRELTATVTEQKANIRALETQLRDEMNKKNDDREIAFSASLMQSGGGYIGPFTTDITLTYRNVFTNIGNAYNPVTGIFTAPLKGAYMFRVSVFGHGPTSATADIVKNGERVVIAHDYRPQHDLNSSNGVVLILEVGDVVYISFPELMLLTKATTCFLRDGSPYGTCVQTSGTSTGCGGLMWSTTTHSSWSPLYLCIEVESVRWVVFFHELSSPAPRVGRPSPFAHCMFLWTARRTLEAQSRLLGSAEGSFRTEVGPLECGYHHLDILVPRRAVPPWGKSSLHLWCYFLLGIGRPLQSCGLGNT
ncbi:unnamed protein product [Leuciscus chuanchicus]